MRSELQAIYFPGYYPLQEDIFAAACIYFSRVNFVTPSMNSGTSDEYMAYLKDAAKKGVVIQHFGSTTEDTEPHLQRLLQFWSFVQRSHSLLGEVIVYHPNKLSQDITQIISDLFGSGLRLDDLSAFIARGEEEADELARVCADPTICNDEFLRLTLPTTRYLSLTHSWMPISDNPILPAPVLRNLKTSADDLAASLALRMLTLSLPAPECREPELLLEVREKMKDELDAFRIMALKLASNLRKLLSENPSRQLVQDEADFLIKTEVEPYLAEIRRRVAVERGRFWRRVFGKTPKWLSLGLTCFSDPSGAALMIALREAAKDAASLLGDAHQLSLAGDPGISLLLRLEQHDDHK